MPRAGEGVLVAVIDTGGDIDHPDIAGNVYVNSAEVPNNGIDDDNNGYIDDVSGWDFVEDDNGPSDKYGHGTHCAGTIAAVANNSIGIAGMAYKAKILAVKGLSDKGSGYSDDLAAGIVYAADMGADVLSNSWGGNGNDLTIKDAVDYAHEKGCVVVAAAGNSNADSLYFSPAGFDNVISVAAFDPYFHKASFSNHGKIEVAAPGGSSVISGDENLSFYNILSLNANAGDNYLANSYPILALGEDYLRAAGTSMACPHVSGLAALIISYNRQVKSRELNPEQVEQIMKLSAIPIIDPKDDGTDWGSPNEFSGAGHIDAAKALAVSDNSVIPTVSITSPLHQGTVVKHSCQVKIFS